MANDSKYSFHGEGAAKVSIYLPAEISTATKIYAEKHGRSASWVIQQALRDYLAKHANDASFKDSL